MECALLRGAESTHPPPIYRSHIENVCALLGMGTEWRTPALRAAVLGMANMPPTTPRFRNILSIDDSSRFSRHEPLSSELGRLGYLAFVSPMRLQPEALHTVMALPGDPLLSRTPRRRKSLIGLYMFGDDVRLVLNPPFAKIRGMLR